MRTRSAFGAVAIILLAARGALAVTPSDLRVKTFSDSLDAPPALVVTFNTALLKLANFGFGVSVHLEWTADGQPMPPDLAGRAECVYGLAPKQYSCEALRNWFQTPAGGRRQYISEHESLQAFRIRNLEFDTEYCFRVRGGFNEKPYDDWTPWVCGRTQPAPQIPPKPAPPQVSVLPAASGKGEPGSGQPLRVLVEWDSTGSNAVAWYSVEVWDEARKGWVEAAKRVEPLAAQEQTIPYSADKAPTDERWYRYRVCAGNIAGKACSDPTRTPQELWRAAKKGQAGRIEFPAKTPTIDLSALHARGASLAAEDPSVAELRNLQPDGPARRGFDIGLAAAETDTAPGPGKQRIRDLLSPAERAAFDAAVSFSLERNRERNRVALSALAEKGEALANADALSTELRNRQAEGPARRGFDIGIAAAGADTAPGPGKQRTHDSLSPAEQAGFTTAVSFTLERNRNAELASKGAAIAGSDPTVAAARVLDNDVLYWLGFDVATGIFGDPALGAMGNTATGPGSLKIRDSLSPAGQRGFNAAVALHLSRKYVP